jgi:hypothetical protein
VAVPAGVKNVRQQHVHAQLCAVDANSQQPGVSPS